MTQKNNGRRGGAETRRRKGEIDHPWQRDRRDRSIRAKVATDALCIEREREGERNIRSSPSPVGKDIAVLIVA